MHDKIFNTSCNNLPLPPLCDAHLHLLYCTNFSYFPSNPYYIASSTSSIEEYKREEDYINLLYSRCKKENKTLPYIVKMHGLHPQSLSTLSNSEVEDNLSFLEHLLQTQAINAIGEVGFDLFSPEYKKSIEVQKEVFRQTLLLGIKYNTPCVLHVRKGLNYIFSYIPLLKRLPAVLFHAFPATNLEATALLNKEVNAYFSIGRQVLNGNKKVLSCASFLPLTKIVLETDAPYGKLKEEKETYPCKIREVYRKVYSLRYGNNLDFFTFSQAIKANFSSIYGVD